MHEISGKLWKLCNILRDDGITYHEYVTELTYLLFLKMACETGIENILPELYRWNILLLKSGEDLKQYYHKLLNGLGQEEDPRIQAIFRGAYSKIDETKNLEKIIHEMNELDWYSAKEEGFGNLYEDLLERNANEKKSGAGQYFTPRVLIDVIIELVDPKAGERCNDPACGTFGFMVASDQYIKKNTHYLKDLDDEQREFQKNQAFSGCELVKETYRMAQMNALLHEINGVITLGDTLSSIGKTMKGYDIVLTNPPFGVRNSGERMIRDDFMYQTNNKQMNFIQHIYNSLNINGRAAVIVPDNVLFSDGEGEKIRFDLMNKCNLHTMLRLPAGIFYAPGIKTNVLFFTRGMTDKGNTKELWIYDLRTDMPRFGKKKPLTLEDFKEFIYCYCKDNFELRKETYSKENKNGRWRKFSYEDIIKRSKTNLDITWMNTEQEMEDYSIYQLLELIEKKSQKMVALTCDLKRLVEEES